MSEKKVEMEVMSKDKPGFRCFGDCPLRGLLAACCSNCNNSKDKYITDSNRHLWSDKDGFWKVGGCSLPRDLMPDECRKYDCRNYQWLILREHIDGIWRDVAMHEIPIGHEVAGIAFKKPAR